MMHRLPCILNMHNSLEPTVKVQFGLTEGTLYQGDQPRLAALELKRNTVAYVQPSARASNILNKEKTA